MVFFRKKKKEEETSSTDKEHVAKEKKVHSLQEIAHERVLTAEGWRRQMMQKAPKPKK